MSRRNVWRERCHLLVATELQLRGSATLCDLYACVADDGKWSAWRGKFRLSYGRAPDFTTACAAAAKALIDALDADDRKAKP